MYHYVYHQDLHEQKYQKGVLDLEGKLNTLGLRGKITRLGSYSTPEETLRSALTKDTETFVIVGDDALFSRALATVEQSSHKPIVGYIPFFNTTPTSQALGIGHGEGAVMCLARRRIERIHMAHVNNDVFFLGSVAVHAPQADITINNVCVATTAASHINIFITNTPHPSLHPSINAHIDPRDTHIEALVTTDKKRKVSFPSSASVEGLFTGRTIAVSTNTPADVLIDGYHKTQTPITVGVSTQTISCIVGKDRLFG